MNTEILTNNTLTQDCDKPELTGFSQSLQCFHFMNFFLKKRALRRPETRRIIVEGSGTG